jgi:hypothetical protein
VLTGKILMRAKLTPALVKTPLATPAIKEEMDLARDKGRDRIFVWDTGLEGFGLMVTTFARP